MNIIKAFICEHKFLFAAIIASLSVAIIYSVLYLYFITIVTISMTEALFYFIPCFIVIAVSVIANFTFKKYKKATKIISSILNSFIIVFVQIIFGFIFLSVASIFTQSPSYFDTKDYKKALKSICSQDRIKHFPSQIPSNAKNVIFFKTSNDFFGSEEIYLYFETDNSFIDSEITKHKYIGTTKINSAKYPIYVPQDYRKDEYNFTFYIINDQEHEMPNSKGFPYFYGIGKGNRAIVYFYNCPD